MAPEFHLFLPQLRQSTDGLVERATAAEAAGFTGMALMDHLMPPMAEDQPMFEAMTAATWLAARTTTLTIGHLVLCDAFRPPAVLARQAVTLDHFSGGRFELAIGSGSVPKELDVFGIGGLNLAERTARLGETLAVLRGLWSGEPVTYDGTYHQVTAGQQRPTPTRPIPIVIGGTAPATMALVAEYADWWNVPVHQVPRLAQVRDRAGAAKVSLQQMVTMVPAGVDGAPVLAAASRRFGGMPASGRAIGSGPELVEQFGRLHAEGIDRFYVWFSDFADPATLAAFGDEVIAALA